MGAPPGVIFQLLESTPNRLTYLCTATGTGIPTILGNAALNPVTPDLHADLPEHSGPILEMVNMPVTNQAEARRVMMGEQSPNDPPLAHLRRAHLSIIPRDCPYAWAVDASEGATVGDIASTGRSVIVVAPPIPFPFPPGSMYGQCTALLHIVVTPSPAS